MDTFDDSIISFKVEDKQYSFGIVHNMQAELEIAVMSWLPRTRDYTDKSFSNYVNNKNSGHLAYTRDDWKLVNKKRIKN